jgi:hypothetical protein
MLADYKVDVEKLAPRITLPKAMLPDYVGIYRAGQSAIRITQRDGRLVADSALGRNELRAMSATRFYFAGERGYVTFTKKAGSRAADLIVHRDGGDFSFVRSKQ